MNHFCKKLVTNRDRLVCEQYGEEEPGSRTSTTNNRKEVAGERVVLTIR